MSLRVAVGDVFGDVSLNVSSGDDVRSVFRNVLGMSWEMSLGRILGFAGMSLRMLCSRGYLW